MNENGTDTFATFSEAKRALAAAFRGSARDLLNAAKWASKLTPAEVEEGDEEDGITVWRPGDSGRVGIE